MVSREADHRLRAFEAIDRDLKDGKVTPDAAERDYNVVVDRRHLAIDRAATERLRAKKRSAAGQIQPIARTSPSIAIRRAQAQHAPERNARQR